MATTTETGAFEVRPSPLVEVSGPPRERGRQYGEQAAARIRKGGDHYSEQIESLGMGWGEIARLARTFEPAIESFDASHLEEMRGIAEGADVDLAVIILLNCRTEILKLALSNGQFKPEEDEPDGCTGVVALPGATGNGRLIHATNWDWKAECFETTVVLKIARDDGPDILTFTEAGALARVGINSAGLAISANYLESDRDYRRLGVPLALIRRKVLEQNQLALAMRTIYCTTKSASNNMILSHADGISISFECAPDETFLVHATDDLIVHANHFQSGPALSKLRDRGIANMPDTLYRDMRVRQLLQPHRGRITADHVKDALFDDFQDPWGVCRPPRKGLMTNLSATVAMLVMDPSEGVMEVAMLPALSRDFTQYRIEMNKN